MSDIHSTIQNDLPFRYELALDSMLFLAWRDASVDKVVDASSGCV